MLTRLCLLCSLALTALLALWALPVASAQAASSGARSQARVYGLAVHSFSRAWRVQTKPRAAAAQAAHDSFMGCAQQLLMDIPQDYEADGIDSDLFLEIAVRQAEWKYSLPELKRFTKRISAAPKRDAALTAGARGYRTLTAQIEAAAAWDGCAYLRNWQESGWEPAFLEHVAILDQTAEVSETVDEANRQIRKAARRMDRLGVAEDRVEGFARLPLFG